MKKTLADFEGPDTDCCQHEGIDWEFDLRTCPYMGWCFQHDHSVCRFDGFSCTETDSTRCPTFAEHQNEQGLIQ